MYRVMAEIFDGNLKQILSLFYALSRFKQHVKPPTGTHTPVTSSVNANHAMTSSQVSRNEQIQHNHVTAR